MDDEKRAAVPDHRVAEEILEGDAGLLDAHAVQIDVGLYGELSPVQALGHLRTHPVARPLDVLGRVGHHKTPAGGDESLHPPHGTFPAGLRRRARRAPLASITKPTPSDFEPSRKPTAQVSCAGCGGIVSDQFRYSMLHRDPERDILPLCAKRGVAALTYMSLEQGLLTGKISMDRVFKPTEFRSNTYWNDWLIPVNRRRVLDLLARRHRTGIDVTLVQPATTHELDAVRRYLAMAMHHVQVQVWMARQTGGQMVGHCPNAARDASRVLTARCGSYAA